MHLLGALQRPMRLLALQRPRCLLPLASQCQSSRLCKRFAGHSKWAKIARGKGENDVARGALYTKISKMISSAARAGGSDPSSNLRLASALDAAKQSNVPKELVERALKSKEGAVMEELVFEAMGPGGVALLITVNTDNPRRTTPAIKYILSKHAAALAATKVFASKACVSVGAGEEAVLDAALGAGAEDVELAEDGAGVRVTCPREATAAVRAALLAAGLPVTSVMLTRVPTAHVELEAGSEAEQVLLDLLQRLEEQEDVLAVLHNAQLQREEEEAA
jgi:YebC/PmpR family DNA-binding regulatory protein